MAKNNDSTTKESNRYDNNSTENTESPYIPTPELDPNSADPNEEVTPGNVQAPIDDEDKLRQDNVLAADHVEKGFPANEIPRTDEEKKRMKDAGLVQ